MLDLILDWIVFPLFEMLSGKHISGKWRLSYLFPIVTALGAGLWWVGDYFGLVPVGILGALITVLAGIASVITFIPREVASWKDICSLSEKRKREVEADEKESDNAC